MTWHVILKESVVSLQSTRHRLGRVSPVAPTSHLSMQTLFQLQLNVQPARTQFKIDVEHFPSGRSDRAASVNTAPKSRYWTYGIKTLYICAVRKYMSIRDTEKKREIRGRGMSCCDQGAAPVPPK